MFNLPGAIHSLRRRAQHLYWLPLLLALSIFAAALLPAAASAQSPAPTRGVPIEYRLPTEGPLPRTYRVTLAITDPHNPNWIVSTFVAGAPRTVTKENQGKFTETWNGLDDNFLPVPPGTYGVKGIYMPARRWNLIGEYHSFIPKFAVGAGDSWLPSRGEEGKQPWMWGAGFGTMTDVAIMGHGKAIFLHNYFEGSGNPLLVDLNKPVGYGQVLRGYASSGTAGGPAVATDGEIIWAASWGANEPNFIYRPDQQPFGHANARYRRDVYVAKGTVTSLAAWRNPASGRRFLYVAETGAEEAVLTLDGESAAELGRLKLRDARAVLVRSGSLLALHRGDHGRWLISLTPLAGGVPTARWQTLVALHRIADPTDFKLDRAGAIYVSDMRANQVYKLDRSGKILLKFGRAAQQTPGHYDDHIFMSPGKLGIWVDAQGHERIIVIERSGPGRVSEWSPDGKLVRQWFPGQVQAVFGYAVDPEDPTQVYMATSEPKSGSGLVGFRVNYDTDAWKVDAVWPSISSWGSFPGGLCYPRVINYRGHKYLAFARALGPSQRYGFSIYRRDGDRWIPSAALIPNPEKRDTDWRGAYFWHDANGDGRLQAAEYRDTPAKLPAAPRYWGERWLDDLSLVIIDENGRSIWRLAPSGFDRNGNPIYDGDKWQKLLTDPIFAARAAGTADPLHGGNEIADRFNLDWDSIAGSIGQGFYVNDDGGPRWPDGIDTGGRGASEVKITRYVPNGKGGFKPLWRVGRKALGLARSGEMYGTLHISDPIDHIVAVQDMNGLVHLFSDEGLYLDTLFFDPYRGKLADGGLYGLNGELFDGYAFLNRQSGKVYLAVGRNAASFYEVQGWTATHNGIVHLMTLPKTVSIAAGQIAAAPEAALRAHGGAAAALVARILPATGGGPALDGSMRGWETTEPLSFGLDAQHRVELRLLYDQDTIYLRWHLRLPHTVEAKDTATPERLFTDGQAADTLSFYIQGDPDAAPATGEPRPGDTRILFALLQQQGRVAPVAIGYYPRWPRKSAAHPVAFTSAVGESRIENVQVLADAKLGYAIDGDRRGLIIAAAIPRADIPLLPPLSGAVHTTIDAEATFAGKTKVWWADRDGSASTVTSDEPSEAGLYPGAWTQAQFVPIGDALPVRGWFVSGPWGGEGLRGLRADQGVDLAEKLALIRFFEGAKYPPDDHRPDWHEVYRGPLTADVSGAEHAFGWRVARVAPDAKAHLDQLARLYFAATWIYSPEDQEIEGEILTAPHNMTRLWIGDQPVSQAKLGTPPLILSVPQERQTIHLRKGWNEVFARTYAVGYDLELGMVLHASANILWKLRLSPTPP